MRYGIYVLLICCSLSLAGQGSGELRFTASFRGVPLTSATEALSERYGLQFSFSRKAVADIRVNCEFTDAPWPEVEQCLFGLNGLETTPLQDGYVSIRRAADLFRPWQICLSVKEASGETLPFSTISLPAAAQNLANNQLAGDTKGLIQGEIRASPTDSLQLDFIGYRSKKVALSLVLGSGCPEITLESGSLDLGTIYVNEYLADGISSVPDGRSLLIKPAETPKVPGFAEGELLRTAALLPGVNSINESATNLSIRGGRSDQNLVQWDGIPVYGGGYFFGMVSPFSQGLVDEIDIYRNQANAGYGGRVAGVIDMRTGEDIVAVSSGSVEASLLGLQANLKLPLLQDKIDVQLSARSSPEALLGAPVYQNYRTQVLESNSFDRILNAAGELGVEVEESFTYREFNGRVKAKLKGGGSLKLSGFFGEDDFDFLVATSGNRRSFSDRVATKTFGYGLDFKQPLGRGEIRLAAAQTEYGNEGESILNGFNRVDNFRAGGVGERTVRLSYQLPLVKEGDLEFGLHGQQIGHDLDIQYANERTDSTRYFQSSAGPAFALAAYGQLNRTFFPKLQGHLGFRLQYYDLTEQLYPEPRLGLTYTVNDVWSVQSNYSRSHQFVQEVVNLNPQRLIATTSLWALADGIQLPVAAGQELSIGLTGRPKAWLLDLQVYHRTVDGMTSLNTVLQRDGLDKGTARSRGIDLLLLRKWKRFRLWGIYSLSSSEWQFPTVSPDYFPAENDRRHQLRLMGSWRKGNWSFVGGWQIQTGAPFTEVSEVSFRPRPNSNREFVRLESSETNGVNLPNFHRLDLTATYDWQSASGELFGSVALSLLNAYGRDNVLDRYYIIQLRDENRPRGLSAEEINRVGLGTTLNLAVKVGFSGRK